MSEFNKLKKGQSTYESDKPNWPNRTLFQGDNLKFMRAMNSESVDLIATDPPFNKSRDFHATPDSLASGASFQDRWKWEKDVHQEWVDQITDDHPKLMEAIESAIHAHSESMGAFMCFMAVRLLAMHRILKPTGSIYLHCDHTASHYLKAAMDAVFGNRNFRNEIIWCYKSGGAGKKQFARKHDVLLFYSKNYKKCNFNELKVKSYGQTGGGQGGKVKYYKDKNGTYSIVSARDWWDISMLSTTHPERTGYPTQKPLALYERVIKASSNEGDIVLDPFAGCATTCVAAEKLGRQWVGIDIWGKVHKVVISRLEAEGLLSNLKLGDINFTDVLPIRTDDGETAAPFLRVKKNVHEPKGPKMSRKEMYEHLLEQEGMKCQGCYREFNDPRYLELDHNTPRSDGGLNHISNRVLLCGPCNKLKSNQYTLSGLRRKNKKLGYMA